MMKSIAIIGSTGSIGKTSLKIYLQNKKNFDLKCLAANSNLKKLLNQKKKYKPTYSFLINKNITNKSLIDKDQFINKFQKKKIDFIISGLGGYEAININFDLLKVCKNLLIANKETIICGGEIFLKNAKKNKCNVVPIDSEHHCIDFFYKNFFKKKEIKEVFIIASGGPFYSKRLTHNESIKKVINHPNWKMGKEISVNSSTFANKVLEIFEAKILFKLSNNQIKIRVEQNSLIHAIIKLNNNFLIPIIHVPNMEIPIKNSLGLENNFNLNLDYMKLNITNPSIFKFPIIKIGFDILRMNNHAAMIFFTVINERLVNMYLNKQIKYGEIAKILIKTFRNKYFLKKITVKNINDINYVINFAKKFNL
tara:strand:+ start:5661 stop:6758 length:1098 start_codon:yes stop_codon:yes gene_type:complete